MSSLNHAITLYSDSAITWTATTAGAGIGENAGHLCAPARSLPTCPFKRSGPQKAGNPHAQGDLSEPGLRDSADQRERQALHCADLATVGRRRNAELSVRDADGIGRPARRGLTPGSLKTKGKGQGGHEPPFSRAELMKSTYVKWLFVAAGAFYLIRPPVNWNNVIVKDAPLSAWQHTFTFDTAEACEQFREKQTHLGEPTTIAPGEDPVPGTVWAELQNERVV